MAKAVNAKEKAIAALDRQSELWRDLAASSGATRAAFEAAVAALPDKANVADEMDWLRAHPAMVRLAQMKDKTKDVVVTAQDVVGAPSKAAVYALIHWSGQPHEFFKMVLSEHKKKTQDDDRKKAEQIDVGLEEVARLLKQVRLAKEESCVKSDITETDRGSMTESEST